MTLADLQSRLKAIVATSTLLAGRPVLLEDKGNLVAEVETALQTQSLAVVVALAYGQAKDGSLRQRAVWTETFEVVIHRGLLDGVDVPASLAVLDDLRRLIQGAPINPDDVRDGVFLCIRHDLRDGGDGTYARVLSVAIEQPISSNP